MWGGRGEVARPREVGWRSGELLSRAQGILKQIRYSFEDELVCTSRYSGRETKANMMNQYDQLVIHVCVDRCTVNIYIFSAVLIDNTWNASSRYFLPSVNFQSLEIFPVFRAFPVFLGKRRKIRGGKCSLRTAL